MERSRVPVLVLLAAALLPAALRCCPSVTTQPGADYEACPEVGLDDVQLERVMVDGGLIRNLTANPALLADPQYQTPVVELTTEQEAALLRAYPSVFALGPVERGRRQAQNASQPIARLCPRRFSDQAAVLALTPGGELVQLAQTSRGRQLLFSEECAFERPVDLPNVGVSCGVVTRIQLALFINLSEIAATGGRNSHFIFSYVLLDHCAAGF